MEETNKKLESTKDKKLESVADKKKSFFARLTDNPIIIIAIIIGIIIVFIGIVIVITGVFKLKNGDTNRELKNVPNEQQKKRKKKKPKKQEKQESQKITKNDINDIEDQIKKEEKNILIEEYKNNNYNVQNIAHSETEESSSTSNDQNTLYEPSEQNEPSDLENIVNNLMSNQNMPTIILNFDSYSCTKNEPSEHSNSRFELIET